MTRKSKRLAGLAFVALCLASMASAQQDQGDEYPPGDSILSKVPASVEAPSDLRNSLGPKVTIESFLKTFRGTDPVLQRNALRDLGRPGNVAAIPYVGAVLLRLDGSRVNRVAAAEALGRIGEARVAAYPSQAIVDPDPQVRLAAVSALGQAAPPGAVALIEGKLLWDPSWWVRYSAATALGQMRQPFAVDALARSARMDEKSQVRLQAALALGELGTDRSMQALAPALSDRDEGVRIAASLALGSIGGFRAVALLRVAFEDETSASVRKTLAISIRQANRHL